MHNPDKKIKPRLSTAELRTQLKLIGSLNRAGMAAGNNGDFDSALGNIKDALAFARQLDKDCLVAKLLNNRGIIFTQKGAWDAALLSYEESMTIVIDLYGTRNCLYKTLQKNISNLFN